MQCIWYAYATALSQQNQNKFGLALRRYNQIDKHFAEYIDDQLDFHPYAIRKQTIRNYMDLLRTFDKLYGHKYFVKTAKGAVNTHLIIHEGGAGAQMIVDGVSLGM
jgi:hypothetical protein